MNTKEPIIQARQLSKIYHLPAEDIAAVNQVDFAIQQGDFVALMGPSGSGKTTLLDLLGCLDTPSEGQLIVAGHDVSSLREHQLVDIRRKGISFVFQEFLLVPSLTAQENVQLPLCFGGRQPNEARAKQLLERVGLGKRLKHLPKELSGGERQRVAIARALVTKPSLLLADEPTGNLDSKNARSIFDLLAALSGEGLTIIVATHDQELAQLAHRKITLKDGKVEQDQAQ